MSVRPIILLSGFCLLCALAGTDEWPTLRHDAARSGRTTDEVRGPYAKRWVRHFPGEIMTSRIEAIVAEGRVFLGTYSGNLYALSADTGETLWTFTAEGPILHSPAVNAGAVFFGCAGGFVYALDARTGLETWKSPEKPIPGGFCTAPAVHKGMVYLGARNGTFYALDAGDGTIRWSVQTGGPIRTSAACREDRIVFASDDMHAYCVSARGELLWRSEKLQGQSLRDYYPVIVDDRAVLRTNPAGPYAEHHGRDRHLLVTHAGVKDHWRDIAEFVKTDATRGTPEKLESERRLVLDHLEKTPDARTFFALDLASGKESVRMPVLYGAGCQGVGIPPVLTNDGRTIVFYRSAYSNWTHGVAPIVAMGCLDFARAAVDPVRHASGNQPPWNTFWGTADESMNFSVGGNILYTCHQGTICGLDLESLRLFHVAGNRDTWAGEPGLPWARNEWHGPARGSAAICGNRIYWATGSRIICVEGNAPGGRPSDKPFGDSPTSAILDLKVPAAERGPEPAALEKYVWETPARLKAAKRDEITQRLEQAVTELIDSECYAPFYVQPGLAKREFFFDTPADALHALSLAYPHLSPPLQNRVRAYLRNDLREFPVWDKACAYPVNEGKRRELFDVPSQHLKPLQRHQRHPLGNLYALWLYVERTGDSRLVDENWPAIHACFAGFIATNWRLDDGKCDLLANRYIAGLIGYARLARKRDAASSREAARLAAQALATQIRSFHDGVDSIRLPSVESVREIDWFIGKGNGLFCGGSHHAKIARFLDLQPEIAAAVRDHAGEAARFYLNVIDVVMPGWYLAGEERQVHFGENFVDYPDQALSIFRAKAMIERTERKTLERFLDIPWCAGDLNYIEKLVRILES